MMPIWRDVAVAWRRLLATPVFTFFSVLTLALSLAAVLAAYAMVRAVAAPPPGVPDVHELLTISHTRFGRPEMSGFSLGDFEDLRRRQTTMGDVAAFAIMQQVLVVDGQSRPSLGELVSGSYFPMLRVPAALGRMLQPADDRPGAPPVIVISHDVWQRLFEGRSDVIGQAVTIAGHRFEVVGVAPPDFVGLVGNGRFPAATWMPLSAAPLFERLRVDQRRDDRNARWLYVRARAPRGAAMASVAAEVSAIGRQLDVEHPIGRELEPRFQFPYAVSRPWVVQRSQDLLMDEGASATRRPVVVMLMIAVGLVLLVACSNLANMIMARTSMRQHELVLRVALGGSRVRLVFGCLTEVLIIVVAGGALGVGLAALLLVWLSGPVDGGRGIVFLVQPRIDLAVLGVALAGAAVAVVVAGAIPCWRLTRSTGRMGPAACAAMTVAPRWRARRVLIAAQVAVSIVLLGTAALFLGQVAAAGRFSGGIDLDRLALAEVDLALQGITGDERVRQLIDQVLDRLQGHPGIDAAAVSAGFPLRLGAPATEVRAAGVATRAMVIAVTPRFFDAAGLQLAAGRTFGSRPGEAVDRPVVVDASLADHLFGRTDVVGRQVEMALPAGDGAWGPPEARTIVGVVERADDGTTPRAGAVYVPLDGRPAFPLVFVVRTFDDPVRMADQLRAALRAAEPAIGISRAGTGRAVAGPSSEVEAMAAGVSSGLGATGLSVVLTGLYGVLSYLVSRRTREIGMRMALGATPRDVLVMVLREGLAPVLVGVVAGGVVAVLLRQSLAAALMLPLPSTDALLLASVPGLILVTTAMACYIPARRAARIDPAVSLKQ